MLTSGGRPSSNDGRARTGVGRAGALARQSREQSRPSCASAHRAWELGHSAGGDDSAWPWFALLYAPCIDYPLPSWTMLSLSSKAAAKQLARRTARQARAHKHLTGIGSHKSLSLLPHCIPDSPTLHPSGVTAHV